MRVPQVALLLVLVVCLFGSSNNSSGAAQLIDSRSSDELYKCAIEYFTQMDPLLLNFSIRHLKLDDEGQGSNARQSGGFSLNTLTNCSALPFEELQARGLNSSLPFTFFINGYNALNEHQEINGTWMQQVAGIYAKRHRDLLRKGLPGERANVVFLTWGIPELYTESMLNIIPSYYKTMSNYRQLIELVGATLARLVDFVEFYNAPNWASKKGPRAMAARRNHYAKFQFYGHSLGAHLITDAILKVRRASHYSLQFGRLVGLDPATPCFMNLEHGLSARRVADSVRQVQVVHSNAGFFGQWTSRAPTEIVLNGGTFQPGCSWYDIECSHARATDILSYLDDHCQMVAYKCTSYAHFKMGACESCETPREAWMAPSTSDSAQEQLSEGNCILVNLEEQHSNWADQWAVVNSGGDSQRRLQLTAKKQGDTYYKRHESQRRIRLKGVHRNQQVATMSRDSQMAINLKVATNQSAGSNETIDNEPTGDEARPLYYYVNTSDRFKTAPTKSHCLQHYQLRLLMLSGNVNNNEEHQRQQSKCISDSPFFSTSRFRNDNARLLLFSEKLNPVEGVRSSIEYDNWQSPPDSGAPAAAFAGDTDPVNVKDSASTSIQLNSIVKDLLYTALVSFQGEATLFVGAILDHFELKKISQCLVAAAARINEASNSSERAATGVSLKFVLDIAFMSNTNQEVRLAYSSILCGQYNSDNLNNGDTKSPQSTPEDGLNLNLCEQSELSEVSKQIASLLKPIQTGQLHEPWRVSLLNSLFSLFTQWEPFK